MAKIVLACSWSYPSLSFWLVVGTPNQMTEKLTAAKRKKAMTEIMSKLAKHFNLGIKYDGRALRYEHVIWLSEHQKDDANELLDKLMKIL